MEYTQYIGIGAGICTAASLVPQLIKLLKEKDAESISIVMLLILITGLAGWVWYGVLKKDIPIMVTNGFSFVVNAIMIGVAVKYKKAKQ